MSMTDAPEWSLNRSGNWTLTMHGQLAGMVYQDPRGWKVVVMLGGWSWHLIYPDLNSAKRALLKYVEEMKRGAK